MMKESTLKKAIALPVAIGGAAGPNIRPIQRLLRSFSTFLIRSPIKISFKKRKEYEEKIIQAGLQEKWNSLDIISSKILLPVVVFIFYFLLALSNDEGLFYLFSILLPAIAYIVPDYWLNTQVKKRKDTIRKELPHYVNAIAIMCEAGLNLLPAIKEVTKRKNGVLSVELEFTLHKITVGLSQADALEEMADRCQVDELSRFVAVINQATERGASGVTLLLRDQAKETWEYRKKKAQQLGAEASMKLFFPLLLLAFPATVVFILGPVMLELFKFIVS